MLHAFDSYKEIKNFTASGFSEDQAQKVVHLVMETQKQSIDHLATKEDIKILQQDNRVLRKEIAQVESSLNTKIDQVESGLKKDIQGISLEIRASTAKTKNTMLMWMMPFLGTNMVAVIGLLVAIFLK